MSGHRFRVVPAVYLALTRDGISHARAPGVEAVENADAVDGLEVLLQLRQGTGYMDGWWACGAAGHVEQGESILQAATREALEELEVTIRPTDLRLGATVHRTVALRNPMEERIDVFFEVAQWSGDPRVAEPDKSAGLRWWPLSALPDKVVPHERQALEHLRDRREPAVLTRGFGQSLTLIAAVGRNGVIGDGAGMPWHLPEDLAFFKRTTLGGTLLMGRGTWDSIGRALPGRRTIVLTRDRDWSAAGAEVAADLPEALLMAEDDEVFVAGGGQVYAQTMPDAQRLLITEVDQDPEGSVTFPEIDPEQWQEVSRESREGFSWVEYRTRG